MSSFDEAIPVIMKNEGGYSNNEYDRGGETNFGITQKFLDNIPFPIKEVKNLTHDDAIRIYHDYLWVPYRLSEINNQSVATKVFDMVVNFGTQQGVKLVQLACMVLAPQRDLASDGIIGSKTISAINALDPIELLESLRTESSYFYKRIVDRDDSQKRFLKGWLARASL